MSNYSFNPGGPQRPPTLGLKWYERTLIFIAGYEPRTLLEQCLAPELGVALALGWVALASVALNAGIFATAAHLIFGGGHFSISLTLAGTAFAVTNGALESYAGRAAHIWKGVQSLLTGGLVIPDPKAFVGSFKHFAIYRISTSLVTAFVASTFLCLAIYQSDILARAQKNFQTANSAVFQTANEAYDAENRRLASAIKQQEAQVSADERLVNTINQADVRKTVNSNGRAATISPPIDTRQLERLETKLNDGKVRLAKLHAEATAQNERRNDNIRRSIETSPTATPRQEGLISQLVILHSLIIENPQVLLMVLALEILLTGLDCAGFIARMGAPSSTYDKLLAKAHILQTVSLAKECADGLAQYDVNEEPRKADVSVQGSDGGKDTGANLPLPSNDNVTHANDTDRAFGNQLSAKQQKRKRGRPSNEELARRSRLNGQADPGEIA